MKRLLSVLLALTLVLVAFCAVAYASGNGSALSAELAVQPRTVYYTGFTANLTFSGGTAHCTASLTPVVPYGCTLRLALYEEVNGAYQYITSWNTSSTNGSKASLDKSYYVGQGSFRIIAQGNIDSLDYPRKVVTKPN